MIVIQDAKELEFLLDLAQKAHHKAVEAGVETDAAWAGWYAHWIEQHALAEGTLYVEPGTAFKKKETHIG